ncbi:unnamed protein product, partial [Rotaria magnacalcarata]
QRLVEQCVKQVTRQVREEVKLKLEQDEIENDERKTVATATATSASKKKRPSSKTHLAFDRHSTTPAGKPTSPTRETST